MTLTEQLRKDVNKALDKLGVGPTWLADQLGEKRVTLHHFLRRPIKVGTTRKVHYDLGHKMRRWVDYHNTTQTK